MGKCKKCGIQLPGRLRVCSQHRSPKNKRGGSRPGPGSDRGLGGRRSGRR